VTDHKPRLGAPTDYPEAYDPGLLVSIPRAEGRGHLHLDRPIHGVDIWTGYELSWLNSRGKPRVAMAEFLVSCDSVSIVESKSFKLYLNSLNQHAFASDDAVIDCLRGDLSSAFGGTVEVHLIELGAPELLGITAWRGHCLDGQDVECKCYTPDASLLAVTGNTVHNEILYSHLLKTNCPVTGQPDWASVQIGYSGPAIDRAGLLQYLVSYRQHQDFHENCVETIFCDILRRCKPDNLWVYARYTRRGGLDINPFRSTRVERPEGCRIVRQ
jgi:7-cyano-7-deazaguanine reductase